MCGFIAQLVEHRTGIAKVTGSNPVETLIFSGVFFPIAYGDILSTIITFISPLLWSANVLLLQLISWEKIYAVQCKWSRYKYFFHSLLERLVDSLLIVCGYDR